MNVTLTGATGFIGSHILTDLQQHGHQVTALVRDDAGAQAVAARGATPAVVDLYNRAAVASRLSDADAAIHTASPGDAKSADLDAAVAGAAIDAFTGTGKPYLHISGAWIYGDNNAITEESPFQAPPWWPGRNRSSSRYSPPTACAESSSSPAPPTATVGAEFPGCCSGRPGTTPAT